MTDAMIVVTATQTAAKNSRLRAGCQHRLAGEARQPYTSTVHYCSFVLPLVARLDGGRKWFEKGKAIRESHKARMVEKAVEKERVRITRELERRGVVLSPDVSETIFGNQSADSTQSTP